MAEENKIELTPKEIALQFLTGKTGAEEETTLTEEQIQAKADADAAAAAKLKEEEEKNKKPVVEIPELTDEQLLAMASKKAGREIKSWDELKPAATPEDKRKVADARDANKLTFGLQQGLFNKNTYEDFITDSKDRKGLVLRAELAEAKKDDPDWDEDKEKEFMDEFNEKFALDLDPTSTKFKRGQRQLNAIADSLLKNTYSSVFSLDSKFDEYERTQTIQQQNQQKILATAPAFKQDVDAILGAAATIDVPMGGETYAVPVSKEIKEGVKNMLLDENFVKAQILKGYKKEEIGQIAQTLMITQHFGELSYAAAKMYHDKHAKGVRGIPEGGRLEKPAEKNADLTPKQQEAIAHFTGVQAPTAN